MSRRLCRLSAIVLVLGLAELAWYVKSHPRSPEATSKVDTRGSTLVDPEIAKKLPPPEPIPPPRQPPPPPRSSSLPAEEPVSLTRPATSIEELRAQAKTANVLICILDAARADHFGSYGYPRETTPNFDRLAAQSVVFEQHFCQHTQTTSSTASLFTSQYPDTHGPLGRMGRDVPVGAGLNRKAFTVEKALQGAGYHTLLFTGNVCASPDMGVGADFESVYWSRVEGRTAARRPERGSRQGDPAAGQAKSAQQLAALLDSLGRQLASDQGRPFFAYVHLRPPHSPYDAPRETKALFKDKVPPGYREGKAAFTRVTERTWGPVPPAPGPDWVNLYDANLRWADWAVGEIERMLKQARLFDSTLLIITADHGQAFREHGYECHTTCPYDEATHIPLLVKFPGGNGPVGRVRALTQTIDITPTVLDLLAVGYPRSEAQGLSLLPLLTGETRKVNDYVYTRTLGEWACYVVRNQHAALLLYRGGRLRALYDLDRDPGMTCNVLAQMPEEAAELTEAFRRFAQQQASPPLDFLDANYRPKESPARPEGKLSEETKRELRALGYIK